MVIQTAVSIKSSMEPQRLTTSDAPFGQFGLFCFVYYNLVRNSLC